MSVIVGWLAWMAWSGCHSAERLPAVVSTSAACDTVPTGPIATWDGGEATWADVEARVAGDVRAARVEHELHLYELRSQALDELIAERLLADAAKAGGHPGVGAYLDVEIERRLDPPKPKEIEAFYQAVAPQLGGMAFAEAEPLLRDELMRRARLDAYAALVDKLRKKAAVRGGVPYPDLPRVDVPIDPSDPIAGATDAPITIVQFAEYQCPYCGRAKPTLDALLRAYPGKVRVVFKDFPLDGHPRARPAAIAAQCAGEQGRYWQMNDALLGAQDALDDVSLAEHARRAGLDLDAWQACVGSGRTEPGIDADLATGRAIGVSATPTFFVDGLLVAGAQPYERFATLIDRELASRER